MLCCVVLFSTVSSQDVSRVRVRLEMETIHCSVSCLFCVWGLGNTVIQACAENKYLLDFCVKYMLLHPLLFTLNMTYAAFAVHIVLSTYRY